MGTDISGICVTTRLEDYRRVELELARLPGTEVHGGDPDHGRLVVVQELETVEDHMEGLRRIQRLEGVLGADLVCHYRSDDRPPASPTVPPCTEC